MSAPQVEPLPELSRADWLRVADVLAQRADELDASDPEIADIYRRDAARIRAQWRQA
jgi:hypothetical protein